MPSNISKLVQLMIRDGQGSFKALYEEIYRPCLVQLQYTCDVRYKENQE